MAQYIFTNSILLIKVQGYRGMEVSIFEVLFFLTLLVYTAPHIMVFGAVTGAGISDSTYSFEWAALALLYFFFFSN